MFSQTEDVVSMLRILCEPTPKFPKVKVYDGKTKTRKGFEVFMQKHVVLYFSGFNSIDSEISFLNYIHKKLEENPKEAVKGFKKEEFKILCIPIVDNKDDSAKIKLRFETLKKYIKCYAVEYFSKLPGLRLIKEELNYTGKPIMPVLTPSGDMMNEDAMDLIFQWGIEAFPFRKIDGEDLSLKWRWFWDVLKKLKIRIQLDGRKYIFIYGGNNRGWIQNLALALDKIKGHETIERADNVIEHYQLGKNDPGAIYRFWKEIEIKKASNLGSEIQEKMESLLYLKGDPHGWVVLSKGSNVKILGHMEPMCETVMDFEIWKDKVLQKEGFDITLKEYYDAKLKEIEAQKLKEMEAQKLKQMEAQKFKEMEAQKLKEMEAQKLKEMEAQKLKELEAQKLKEKLKEMEAQKLKEIEAQKLKELEAQKLKEIEAQKLKQMEAQKLEEQEAHHKPNDDDDAKVKKVPVDATHTGKTLPPFRSPKKSICEQICSCIKGIFKPCCSCD
ncbi:Sieve element occlusion [Stylosanthes scabra]|uniref:Sieve element occlusion n=1 Tax=Stylosanthes scabra TaxID=79078 RepID=A0ABU6QBN1_9FABA|nr:Sieve element occlusion [Stylosanthes scabra]